MKILSILRWGVTALLLAIVAAVGLWYIYSPSPSRLTVHEAKIKDLREMVRLCTVEIVEDVPVRGHVGTRHIFARDRLVGSISFDLERLEMHYEGDTLKVVLPEEIVEIRESTDPGSYMVIDTWNDRFLGSGVITASEENRMKSLVRDSFRRAVYRKGYVARARSEAVANLSAMLRAMTHGPVVVTDPSPDGYPPEGV